MASKRTVGEATQESSSQGTSSTEEPPAKKFHIEPTQIGSVSSTEELDLKVLKVQNKKLMDRLEQRQLLENELRNRIESLQQRQRMDESLLGMVNKYWTQLDEDIKILVQQFTVNTEVIEDKKDEEEKVESEAMEKTENIEDEKSLELETKENRPIASFLAELMICDHSEIDQLLLDRCQFSKKAVANLLKAFDDIQQKYEKLVWKIQGGTAEENKEEIFIGVNTDLEAENKKLKILVSELQAKHHETTIKFTEKTDQLLGAETRVAELTKLMEDLQYDVEKAKLRAFKLEQLLEESYTKLKNRALATSGEYANTQVQGIVSELDDHKDLADKRLVELDKLQEQHQEKIKELEQMKMDLQHIPEAILIDTAPYKCLQSQFTVLHREAQDMRSQLDESRNLLTTTKNAHLRQIEQMESDELACQKKLRLEVIQLEDTLAQVRKEYEMLRIEFEQNLAANEQAGPINRELRHLVSSFQNHNQQLKGEINRYKRKLREAHLEINKLRHEASRRESVPHGHSSNSAPSGGSEKGESSQEKEQMNKKEEQNVEEKKEKEKDKDREKLKELEKKDSKTDSDIIKDLKAQLKKSQENQKEMKLLLDMYKGAPKEQREKAMLLAAEKRAKVELEELRAKIKQLEERDQKETRHLSNEDAMRKIRSMDELVHQLQRKLADRKQEEEALLSEMDVTGQAFEDMQEQNTRLLQQLREKDDANFKLMSERIKSNQIHKLLREEKDVLADQVNTLQSQVDAQNQVVRKLEEKERILQTTLSSIEKELTLRQNASEMNRKKAMENSQSTADLKLQYEKMSKQVIDLQKLVKENSSAVEQENHKFRRSQEEIVGLKRKVERYKRIELTSSADEVLMEEIRTYKDLLTCPCCKKGRKNVILSKCYHVFCFDCIKTRYETRQRKCPKCNAGFGANDYHRIWLDS